MLSCTAGPWFNYSYKVLCCSRSVKMSAIDDWQVSPNPSIPKMLPGNRAPSSSYHKGIWIFYFPAECVYFYLSASKEVCQHLFLTWVCWNVPLLYSQRLPASTDFIVVFVCMNSKWPTCSAVYILLLETCVSIAKVQVKLHALCGGRLQNRSRKSSPAFFVLLFIFFYHHSLCFGGKESIATNWLFAFLTCAHTHTHTLHSDFASPYNKHRPAGDR